MFPFAEDKQDYLERVKANILPLSRRKTLEAARFEWLGTGKDFEYEEPFKSCGLCDKQGIRSVFQILNKFNGSELLIGSECRKKFHVAKNDEDSETLCNYNANTRSFLKKQLKIMWALQKLLATEPNEYHRTALSYYEDRGCLTPKLANIVLWRLKFHGIRCNPGDFNVRLEKECHLEDLSNLEEFQIERMLPALLKGKMPCEKAV